MPIAVITPGTITGAIRNPRTGTFQGPRPRTNANAASVPSTVARTVTVTATLSESSVASVHSGLLKNSSNQRVEKPGGGNWKVFALVNANGITTRVGATRSTPTRTQKTLRRGCPRPSVIAEA